MPIEAASYIADLNSGNPASTDGIVQGDDHLRLIKGVLKAQFPNFTSAAFTLSQADVSSAVTSIASVQGWFVVTGGGKLQSTYGITSTHTNTGFTAFNFNAQAQSTSYDSYQYVANVNRAASTAFNHFGGSTSNGANQTFRLQGDGQAYCDGAWNGGGADYAEWFEWADGNPSLDDRVGYAVSLVGNKITMGASDPADLIGVVSAYPSVVGDHAEMQWKQKWLRDPLGRPMKNAAGEPMLNPSFDKNSEQWLSDASGAYKVDEAGEKVPNPSYDPSKAYKPRSERPEWATIGLLGKLRVRKGTPVNPKWRLMRSVGSAVDEYLVI